MASNAKVAADLASQPSGNLASEDKNPRSEGGSTVPSEKSDTRMESRDKSDNAVHNGETSPRPLHIAPGSARKTGRPVGKVYAEHLFAHRKDKGPATDDLARIVLQLDEEEEKDVRGEDGKKVESPIESRKVELGSKSRNQDALESQNGIISAADGGNSAQGEAVLENEDNSAVRSSSSNNGTGPPKLFLATDNAIPTDAAKDIPATVQPGKSSGGDRAGSDAPQKEPRVDQAGDDEAPSLTRMVDPRVASLRASESESGTSQSENEGGGEEPQEKRRRRGSRKRKKIGPQKEQVKDTSLIPKQTKSSIDNVAGSNDKIKNGEAEDGQEKGAKEAAGDGDGLVGNDQGMVKEVKGGPSTESAKGNHKEDKGVDAAISAEEETVDSKEDKSDSSESKEVTGAEASDKPQEGIIEEDQTVAETSKEDKLSIQQPVKPVQKKRPKRTIKHKFLEASETYEQGFSGQLRGRGRGSRSILSGIVVRRRGGRGRGRGGSRGRGGRGTRGAGRGRGRATRKTTRGRGRWTHQKARKIYPIIQASQDPPLPIPAQVTEEANQDSQADKPPVQVVRRRGGFRGSRRRGSTGRGGYRNVAHRTKVAAASPQKTDTPEILKEVLAENITSAITPMESEEAKSVPENTGEDTDSLNNSKIKDIGEAPRLPEVRMELGKASEIVMAVPPQERFPIPFAGIRGKARKSYKSKNNTHFGQRKMKRKLKRKMAESLGDGDPSRVLPSEKRLQHANNSSPVLGATEDDGIRTTHTGRMAPPSATPIKSSVSRDHDYGQSDPPLCCCKLVQDKPITAIADNCEAMEIVNGKVAVCTSKVSEAKVMRPSSRIPFRGFCQRHKKRMKEHRCCPGCGCFCTTGLTMVCTIDGAEHHFHKECIREVNEALYCPHCGEDARLAKELSLPDLPELKKLTIMPESVLLSHQRVKLPLAFLESLTGLKGIKLKEALEGCSEKLATPRAKMTGRVGSPNRTVSPVMPETPPHQDDSVFQLQLRTGRTLTSGMLPQGPSRESLEMAMKFMDPENPRRLRFAPKNLYMASSLGEIEKVLQMLGEGFDPNYHFPAYNRETPVHAAAAKGHLDIVCMLVQAGANLDAEDEDHRTPLHLAVEKEKFECAKFLCRHGANPSHKDDDGTAVVHIATMKGNQEMIKYLLSRKKVLINTQDNGGWTPIIWAADNKNAEMVSFLLDYGADPNIRDKEQNIALHWAAYSGCEEVLEVLMNHCSFMDGLVNAVNMHGDTPLHVAAREDNLGCVTQLLMRKADGKICNKEGNTPLDCSRHKSDVWLAIESNICINIYAQKRNLRTERILSRDICRGRENVPIPVINSIDDAPLPNNFLYVADNCETSRLDIDRNVKHMQGCHCDDDCSTGNCPCGQSSVRCWYSPEGILAEDFNYQEPPLLFECGIACHCWTTCRNRVVQNGIKAHLQLFRTARMGWGLRTTHNIPKGSFICQYAGELISDAEADKREDDSYLFDLENREGDVYCIDARFYGNISRFINHLCDPNIVPVRVFIEHWDLRFPHIAFFTSREVKAFEELGFDYGDKFWSIKSKYFTCNCGSKVCKHEMAPEPQVGGAARELDH